MPRFVGENLARNQKLVDTLKILAGEKGVTPSQLAIAWVMSKGDFVIPVMGARTRSQLAEALQGAELKLSAEEITRLEEALPASEVAGERYPDAAMKQLDSER